MIPSSIPVFTSDDILVDSIEYEEGDQRTAVGWLKHLFLWAGNDEYLIITDKDRKDYSEAEATFRRVNGISRSADLHDWEDSQSAARQARALNKFRKEIGYVVTHDRD